MRRDESVVGDLAPVRCPVAETRTRTTAVVSGEGGEEEAQGSCGKKDDESLEMSTTTAPSSPALSSSAKKTEMRHRDAKVNKTGFVLHTSPTGDAEEVVTDAGNSSTSTRGAAAVPRQHQQEAALVTPPNEIESSSTTTPAGSSTDGPDLSDASCAVCLSDFADGERCRRLPCGHVFHLGCIDKWLRKNRKCPLCLQDITAMKRKGE